jgi:hypothetical protein
MKSIFTLLFATVFTIGAFAADHRPSVKIMSSGNYQIVVDGRAFHSDDNMISLNDLRYGSHDIQIYENRRGRRGGWGRRAQLVSSATFRLDDGDVFIRVDRDGNVQVRERDGRNNRGWGYDRDRNYDHDRNYDRDDRNGRDFK